MNVMVLCSDAQLAESIVQLLQGEEGTKVVRREDFSRDVLCAVQDSSPEVVVVDVRQKGSRGLEAVYELRRILPASRIIAVGTHDSKSVRCSLAECGADAFVRGARIRHDLARAVSIALQKRE